MKSGVSALCSRRPEANNALNESTSQALQDATCELHGRRSTAQSPGASVKPSCRLLPLTAAAFLEAATSELLFSVLRVVCSAQASQTF